jgi:hypothetical protein
MDDLHPITGQPRQHGPLTIDSKSLAGGHQDRLSQAVRQVVIYYSRILGHTNTSLASLVTRPSVVSLQGGGGLG